MNHNSYNSSSNLNARSTDNVRIGGGEEGQVLTSDGQGGTKWSGGSSNSAALPIIILLGIASIVGWILNSELSNLQLIMYGVGIVGCAIAFLFICARYIGILIGLMFSVGFYFIAWLLYFGHDHVAYAGGLNCLYFSLALGQLAGWFTAHVNS